MDSSVKPEALDLDARIESLKAARDEKLKGRQESIKLGQIKALEALDAAEGTYDPNTLKLVNLSDGRFVILKRPRQVTFKKFLNRKTTDWDAQYEYVLPCVVAPEKPDFGQLIEELPGLVPRCAMILNQLAEVQAQDLVGE